ncbi:MAG: TRAP transporter large permease subunit [Gammaproteobacteria bacterium]|nr:TRAP transporter large permease subunit [Gammaproteobacteria bacterium]
MILVGCGAILSWILAVERVPELLNAFLVSTDMSAVTSLVFLNVFLLIAGMFIDTAAAIILFSPLLMAAATNVGIHPLHFSVIMILNLNIGLLTPPLGICLLTAESIAGCELPTLIRALAPFLLVNIIALLIITYIPEISLLLPRYLGIQ